MLRNLFLFTLVLCIFLPSSSFAAGDIQITCEPGVRIWLDGNFKGKSTSDDFGMFLENIAPGEHEIKAAKSGYNPEIKKVVVKDRQTIEVKLEFRKGPSIEVVKIGEEEQTGLVLKVGSLVARSVPLKAEVFLDGKKLGITDFRASNIPVGNHEFRFTLRGSELKGTYEIKPDEELNLKAHFKKNSIISEYDQSFRGRLTQKSETLEYEPPVCNPNSSDRSYLIAKELITKFDSISTDYSIEDLLAEYTMNKHAWDKVLSCVENIGCKRAFPHSKFGLGWCYEFVRRLSNELRPILYDEVLTGKVHYNSELSGSGMLYYDIKCDDGRELSFQVPAANFFPEDSNYVKVYVEYWGERKNHIMAKKAIKTK